jgi:uncharacterized protein YjdB
MIMITQRKSLRRWFNAGIFGVSVGMTAGCSDAVSDVPSEVREVGEPSFATAPSSMTIDPGNARMAATATVTMVAKDQTGAVLPVQWFTTDATVASVSPGGTVTARRNGRAVVSARWGNQAVYSANSTVEVTANTAPSRILLEPAGGALTVGQTVNMVARNQDGVILPVQWFTIDPSIASITSAGVLTAHRTGRAMISARWGNQAAYSATVTFTIGTSTTTPPPPPPAPTIASIVMTPTSASVVQGSAVQLAAQARDAQGAPVSASITWASSNQAVATVSSSGLVSGLAAGGATITASAGGQTAAASLTVTAPVPPPAPVVATVAINPATSTLNIGGTAQLTAQARDSSGAVVGDVVFVWVSNNPAVATVTASGLVTAVAGGTATIAATSSNGRSGYATITVNAPPPPPAPVVTTVAVSPASATLNVGATSQLGAQARDANGAAMSGVTFTWSSSNTAVATVSNSGLVTAVGAGSATIRATAPNSVQGSAAITVNAPLPPPPPPPPSGSRQFIFTSDWSSELGLTTLAKTDGSRWNIISDPGNGLSVLNTCQSLGFPSATCLQVDGVQSATGFARLAKTGMPIPAVGESMYFRWYYRHEQPSLGDNSQHPIESGQAGGLDWCFNTETTSNTTWRPEFRTGGDQGNALLARWTGPTLRQGVTYRFEMQIQKISNTELYLHVRVYDAAGNLIASDADFTNDRLGNTGANARNLGMNPVLHFATNGGTNLHEIRAGVNGISNSDWFPRVRYGYQGAFAVCRGGWCGAYAPGEGR